MGCASQANAPSGGNQIDTGGDFRPRYERDGAGFFGDVRKGTGSAYLMRPLGAIVFG